MSVHSLMRRFVESANLGADVLTPLLYEFSNERKSFCLSQNVSLILVKLAIHIAKCIELFSALLTKYVHATYVTKQIKSHWRLANLVIYAISFTLFTLYI